MTSLFIPINKIAHVNTQQSTMLRKHRATFQNKPEEIKKSFASNHDDKHTDIENKILNYI